MYASALPMESRSNKICVKINKNLKKNIPYIIDRNLKIDWQILLIFGRNIALVSTLPNVCFCTT